MKKVIYVKRTAPFKHDQITSEAMQEELSTTNRSIGSYYVSKDSSRLGSGCTDAEEKYLISLHLGMDKTDPKLSEEIRKFYSDIVVKIPGGKKGLELNIGLEDNTKELIYTKTLKETVVKKVIEDGKEVERSEEKTTSVVVYNQPDKIIDYIRYRHVCGYPFTALSPEAIDVTTEYYIEDPEKVIDEKARINDLKDQAMQQYLIIRDDNDKVNMVLSLMRGLIRKEQGVAPINPDAMKPASFMKQKVVILKELCQMRYERFVKVTTDPNIKKLYFIDQLLTTGILKRNGSIIIDTTDSNQPVGATNEDVLTLLWDGKESTRLSRLKGELEVKLSKQKLVY